MTRNESPLTGRPWPSRVPVSWPLRNTPSHLWSGFFQSRRVIRRPSSRNHHTSGSPGDDCSPARKRSRRKTGSSRRSLISRLENSFSARPSSPRRHSTQEISLSWHHALLLPYCVRQISSPPSIIGTPCESTSVVRKFRRWRARSALTSGSSVGPSTPQFQDRLSSVPSRLSSLLASLCFSLYETRSLSVNPSCAVMKLIDANGLRPSDW